MATYYMKDDGKYYRKEDDEKIRVGNYDIDPNEDYMSGYNKSLAVGDLNAAAEYERKRNAKIEAGYGNGYSPTYNLNYKSKYDDKIEALRGDLENYKKFSYDPMKDDAYKSLVGVYNKNALNASKNAMTQAAIQNGGRLSSNAMVAASLAYGDQMSQLQAEIPQLREAAYNMYLNEKNDKRNLMNDYISAENENYGRWSDNYNRMYQNARDLIGDKQWQAQMDYNKERALVGDAQWQAEFDYGKSRDLETDRKWQAEMDYNRERDAVSDSQWRDSFEAQHNGRKASGGSSGSRKGSDPSVGQPNNDATVGINTQSAYNKAIKGATPAERQQIALNMLTNGEITVTQYQEILSKIAG